MRGVRCAVFSVHYWKFNVQRKYILINSIGNVWRNIDKFQFKILIQEFFAVKRWNRILLCVSVCFFSFSFVVGNVHCTYAHHTLCTLIVYGSWHWILVKYALTNAISYWSIVQNNKSRQIEIWFFDVTEFNTPHHKYHRFSCQKRMGTSAWDMYVCWFLMYYVPSFGYAAHRAQCLSACCFLLPACCLLMIVLK